SLGKRGSLFSQDLSAARKRSRPRCGATRECSSSSVMKSGGGSGEAAGDRASAIVHTHAHAAALPARPVPEALRAAHRDRRHPDVEISERPCPHVTVEAVRIWRAAEELGDAARAPK